VFGSPFYFLGKEAFWGQDRLQFLEDALTRSTNQGKSSPTISANQRKFPQLFQPFRENDICEFESSHPSHAVGFSVYYASVSGPARP
jgi:hypothetical protein